MYNRDITLDLVKVTESAALSASLHLGRGDKELADAAAVDAMRGELDNIDMRATVIIGEGEKDKAPMLYIGEQVGSWQENAPEYDIAVDPIDGTRLVAYGLPNAVSVLALTEKGKIPSLPTFYSLKLAVGPELAGKLDINAPIRENIRVAAAILGIPVSEFTVVLLNRDRHRKMIEDIRNVGARIKLISDGDIAAAIATAIPESGVNMYLGIGGTPEGILAAAALKTLEGEIQTKLWPQSEEERANLEKQGIDLEKVYFTEDLVGDGEVIFVATGITDGDLLKGVKYVRNTAITESIAMRSSSRTVRKIIAYHNLKYKTIRCKSKEGSVRILDIKRG